MPRPMYFLATDTTSRRFALVMWMSDAVPRLRIVVRCASRSGP